MNDPAASLKSLQQRFWLLALLLLIFIFLMRRTTAPLSSEDIIHFEMAKTADNAAGMLVDWSASAMLPTVRTSIYLDFVLIFLYSAFFFYGCRLGGRLSGNYVLRKAGDGFAWLAIAAGICDIVENTGMLFTINHTPIDWVVHLSYDMATIKFSLLIINSLFIILCLLLWLGNRLVPARN